MGLGMSTREPSSSRASTPHVARTLAVCADAAARTRIDLALLWRELISERARVVDSFHTDDRCYLVVELASDVPPAGRRRLTPRKIEILERILLGQRQKIVALDFGLAPSTVALTLAECLRTLGLDGRASRAPALLVMAALASRGRTRFSSARLSSLGLPPGEHLGPSRSPGALIRVVSALRPDGRLAQILSPAECAVARALIEGKSYAGIAWQRGTSVRTIANQIGAIFQKLRVSGRSELVGRLVLEDGLPEVLVVPESVATPRRSSVFSRRWAVDAESGAPGESSPGGAAHFG